MGFFAGNSKGDRCQLLELEGQEGYSKCRTQQTSKGLQEYGADTLEVAGVRGV
jgi:hypothetical protein